MSKSMKKALQKQMTKVNKNFKQAEKLLESCKNEKCIPEKKMTKEYKKYNELATKKCTDKFDEKSMKCRANIYIDSKYKKMFSQNENCKIKNCLNESKRLIKTLNNMYKKKRSLDKQYTKSMKTNNKNNKKK